MPLPARRRLTLLDALALGLLLGVAGCRDDVERYFPERAGLRWLYGVELVGRDGPQAAHYALTSLGRQALRGQDVILHRFPDSSAVVYRHTPRGIVRSGHLRSDGRWQAERAALILPRHPRVGQVWAISREAAPLRRVAATLHDARRSLPDAVPMTARVVATDARVRVPAGVFDDCLHVVARGRDRVATAAGFGIIETGIETEDWYAPGVGLVRSVRREATDRYARRSVQVTLELLRVDD